MYLYGVTPGASGAIWDAAFKNKHFIYLSGLTVSPRTETGAIRRLKRVENRLGLRAAAAAAAVFVYPPYPHVCRLVQNKKAD